MKTNEHNHSTFQKHFTCQALCKISSLIHIAHPWGWYLLCLVQRWDNSAEIKQVSGVPCAWQPFPVHEAEHRPLSYIISVFSFIPSFPIIISIPEEGRTYIDWICRSRHSGLVNSLHRAAVQCIGVCLYWLDDSSTFLQSWQPSRSRHCQMFSRAEEFGRGGNKIAPNWKLLFIHQVVSL